MTRSNEMEHIAFPNIRPRSRNREYNEFMESLRDRVVYEYLFTGLSHRQLDETVLEMSAEYSRGYKAMGILHHLGLVGAHKGIFRTLHLGQAIDLLAQESEFDKVRECLIRFSQDQLHEDEFEQDVDADLVKEGTIRYYYGKRYERDPHNRNCAIEIHGLSCLVCGFNYEKTYGERGKDFIEVHHTKPLSTFGGEEQEVDPASDLVPVCSNCHRMIHRRHDDVLSIDQLKATLKKA